MQETFLQRAKPKIKPKMINSFLVFFRSPKNRNFKFELNYCSGQTVTKILNSSVFPPQNQVILG